MSHSTVHPPSNRPVATGVNGMVTSAHPWASMAGLRALMDGGNAFDAAVATAAAIGVAEPYMSGPGGIGMALLYDASANKVRGLNFSGRAPAAAHPGMFGSAGEHGTGPLAAQVPGNVAGWLTIHETYGTMELERLLRPAIEYAEKGIAVTAGNARTMIKAAPRLAKFAESASIVLGPGGRPPAHGSRLRFWELARSLEAIARGGKDEFYRGALAARIVKGCQDAGGVLTADDLAGYDAYWQEPITINYRGHVLNSMPPNSSGFQILQTLKTMEQIDCGPDAYQRPETLHYFIEAAKLAVTDRIEYGGDPDNVTAPLETLLSDEYAERQRARIDMGSAAVVRGERFGRDVPNDALAPGTVDDREGGMTTHFAAIDRDGNVASVTQTLGGAFGCAVAVGGTGIFLNNMALWFDLEEGSPNLLGPRRRVDFVLSPIQTFRDGRFLASMGTPGSYGILQTTPQFLMNVLDYGMDVQQAIEAPRLKVVRDREVDMEERFPVHVRRALEDMGHAVNVIEAYSPTVGGAHGIVADSANGVYYGGADPRRDGAAIGW